MLSYGGWTKLEESRAGVRTRSYFGIYTVTTRRNPPSRQLTHGTTLHGVQNLTPGGETEPTSYYARRSGVGHALGSLPMLPRPECGGRRGRPRHRNALLLRPARARTGRFFEIDPAMVRIARNPSIFTFLSRCAPQAKVVLGDARLSLAREPPGRLDLLAVDAFSSDAIPIHLLTREALQVYRRALKPDGLLLVHISNRYLDLEPVLAAAAKRDGWHAAAFDYSPAAEEEGRNLSRSVWVAMARDADTLMTLQDRERRGRPSLAPAARPAGLPGLDRRLCQHPALARGLERLAAGSAEAVTIETARLRLRDWREEDIEPFIRHLNVEPVMRWLGGVRTREQQEAAVRDRFMAWQEKLGFTFWAVERKEDGELLGFCGLKIADDPQSPVEGEHEVGWRLREDAWGQGYAKEAASASLDFAFGRLGAERVVALTVDGQCAELGADDPARNDPAARSRLCHRLVGGRAGHRLRNEARAMAKLIPFGGKAPRIDPAAFVAPGAVLIGDIEVGPEASIWYNCVLRGDVNHIRIGARSNIQDGTVLHVDSPRPGNAAGLPTIIGEDVLIGHMAMVHGCILHDRAFVGLGRDRHGRLRDRGRRDARRRRPARAGAPDPRRPALGGAPGQICPRPQRGGDCRPAGGSRPLCRSGEAPRRAASRKAASA